MNQLLDFFGSLFDYSLPQNWHHDQWGALYGWLSISSNLLAWSVYIVVPLLILIIFYLYWKLTSSPAQKAKAALEKELQQKNRELNEMFERLTDAFIAIDKDFRYTYINPKAGKLLHVAPQEVIGRNIWEVFPDVVGTQTYHAFHKAMTEQKDVTYVDYYAPFDLWFENNVYPSPNGFTVFTRDITAKKKTELQLEQNELKYRTLIEQASDGILISDQEGYYIDANSSITAITGYSKKELLSMHSRDLLFAEDLERTPLVLERLRNEGKTITERQIKRKDGSGMPVEISATMLPDGNFMGIIRDITERRKVEQLTTKEQSLSASVINSLPGIFYLYDTEGKFLKWNRNFETVSGYTAEEISRMHPLDFFDDDEKQLLTERISKVFTEGDAHVEAGFLTKSRQKIPYYFTGKLIQYEGEACLIGIGLDITDKVRAQEELERSERKYRLLFDNNPLPMWMIDVNTLGIIDVNEAAIEHYGYSRQEFLGMTIRDIRPTEDIQKVEDAVNKQNASIRKTGVWTHLKKDGTKIKVEITSHDINYQNQPTRLILSNDISAKVKAEDNLLKLNDELRELYTRQQNIREEERKHIAREIHDELGQLITGLKMDISWLKKKIIAKQPELTEKMNETIGMLDESVKTIRKISSELRPGILDDLGITDAIRWLAKDFERRTNIKCTINNIEGEIKCSDEVKVVVFRIFQETLTNVMRHAQATEVVAELSRDTHTLTMQIADNGKGFDVAVQTKTLGLLGMKERIFNIKGELYISSAVGRGTTVTIIIPI